jgi:hypothetical protein
MTTRTAWTPAENAALVRLYFQMLDSAIAGKPYNKAAMIRAYQGIDFAPVHAPDHAALANRSRGSIEAKLMNASAAHRDVLAAAGELGVTMDGYGYRCLGNYQAALLDAMRTELGRRGLEQWRHRA